MEDQPKKYHKYSRWERGEARPIQIIPRDLDILHKLFIHGALSSDMLHQLVSPRITLKSLSHRFKNLHRKPNAFIDRPPQQKGVYNAHYRPLAYAINPKGIQVLKDFGRVTSAAYRI
ncbi:MAG: hypothetical protein DLM68_13880, partial [Hyphomicrobiales bacterium]